MIIFSKFFITLLENNILITNSGSKHVIKNNDYINIVYNDEAKRVKILRIIPRLNVAILEPDNKL